MNPTIGAENRERTGDPSNSYNRCKEVSEYAKAIRTKPLEVAVNEENVDIWFLKMERELKRLSCPKDIWVETVARNMDDGVVDGWLDCTSTDYDARVDEVMKKWFTISVAPSRLRSGLLTNSGRCESMEEAVKTVTEKITLIDRVLRRHPGETKLNDLEKKAALYGAIPPNIKHHLVMLIENPTTSFDQFKQTAIACTQACQFYDEAKVATSQRLK
eukprot:GHVO01032308.1.p1 GENE.GHVO01032308.1~~GHVO01032308.1.p1  ORF type:complete len:216 (-),score=29.54 GHVO01032308.1:194-841(-)